MHWDFFRFINGQFHPSFSPTRKMLLRNSSWAVSAFWITPFSNNSGISWSTSRNCCFGIFIVFGGFSWTGRFVNCIWNPFTIDKMSWSSVIFSHCFTNCNSLPASCTFGISSVNYFLSTGCIKVIDASGTSFELLVKGNSFRFSKEVFTLNFHVEVSFRYNDETDFGIYHVYVGLDYQVFPRSNTPDAMQFILACKGRFRKGAFFLPTSLKVSNDFFLDFSISIIWDRNFFPKSENFQKFFLKHGLCFSRIFRYYFQDAESTGIWNRKRGLTQQ